MGGAYATLDAPSRPLESSDRNNDARPPFRKGIGKGRCIEKEELPRSVRPVQHERIPPVGDNNQPRPPRGPFDSDSLDCSSNTQ
jgi:hypothetical protein